MERAIRFLGKKDERAKGRLRGLYDALGNISLDILLKDFELSLRKVVDRTKNRTEAMD